MHGSVLGALALVAVCAHGATAQRVDWPTPSGDPGAMRWSPLADVNRDNVGQLQVAWTWKVRSCCGTAFLIHRFLPQSPVPP